MPQFTRILLAITTVAICSWYFIEHGRKVQPFYGDAMGYYMYLPCVLIYQNLHEIDQLPKETDYPPSVTWQLSEHKKEGRYTPKGYLLIKYTYGVAALESPFFLLAHLWEKLTGGKATGYSAPYSLMLKIAGIFYSLLGLALIYIVLRRFYESSSAFLVVCLTLAGTNLFWFSFHQAGMSHVPLFFLYSLLLYLSLRIAERPRLRFFLMAGLTSGFITLIRPTDVVCLLIPALFGVWNRDTLKQKAILLRGNKVGLTFFIIAFILPMIPQMIYWKKYAGSYLYYSYTNEGFNWASPKIIAGLFHFNNGWLAYTHLMFLALAGLAMFTRIRSVALVIYTVLPLYIYIIYSWYCYNYINGLGSRPMIHMYPLLAIPLCAFISFAWQKNAAWKASLVLVLVFCVSSNICYSLQQARDVLFSEESNAVYNLSMMYKLTPDYADLVANDVQQLQPEEKDLHKISIVACRTNDDSTSARFIPDTKSGNGFVYSMYAEEEYYPYSIKVKYEPEQFAGAKWVKCSGRFLCPLHYDYYRHIMTFEIINGQGLPWWWGCKIDNKIGLVEQAENKALFRLNHCETNKWGYVYFYIKIPISIRNGDELVLNIWNIGKMPMLIDDLSMELYR